MTQPPRLGLIRRLWRSDRVLTGAGLLMVTALIPSLLGLWLDPRLITGAPAWLKPAKFAISTAIFLLTLAWIFTYLPEWRRTRRAVSWTTALALIIEVAIIDVQAWRGTTSHFNVATPLDATLFTVMGAGILVQTLGSIAVAVALWRQAFSDAAMGWALRMGMSVSIAGAAVGGIMTQPTSAQLAEAAQGRILIVGAHTVGAPDGGPGLPVTGWSTQAGDLRVPHFVGLHAMQVFPFLAFVTRRRPTEVRQRVIVTASLAYVVLFAVLLAQALQGLPLRGA